MEKFSQCVNLLISVFTIISIVISIILAMKGFYKKSLKNTRKKYEYYKEIITNGDNKVLAYTGLKEYLGFSISDAFAEHIIKSTKFYDVINVLKITQDSNMDFDLTTNKIIHKKGEPKRCPFIIFYIIFILPLILFLTFFDTIAKCKEHLIVSIMFVILWTIPAIFFLIEIKNRTLVIKLLEKMKNEPPCH